MWWDERRARAGLSIATDFYRDNQFRMWKLDGANQPTFDFCKQSDANNFLMVMDTFLSHWPWYCEIERKYVRRTLNWSKWLRRFEQLLFACVVGNSSGKLNERLGHSCMPIFCLNLAHPSFSKGKSEFFPASIVCVIKFNSALPKQCHFHFRENNLFVCGSKQAKQMVSRLKGVSGKQFLHYDLLISPWLFLKARSR